MSLPQPPKSPQPSPQPTRKLNLPEDILPFVGYKCPNSNYLVCNVCSLFDVDEKILVCGLSHVGEGGAKVIDVESRTIITHLDHQKASSGQRIVKHAVTDILLTKNWIVTATQERIFAWSRDNYRLVKDFAIIERMCPTDFSATESKKNLFIAYSSIQHNCITRISATDSPPNQSTIKNRKPWTRVFLSNGVLVTSEKTNNGVDNLNLTLTIYNLEVSGMEMLKLASNQVWNTHYPLGTTVRDRISYPYFVEVHGHPEQNLTVQGGEGYFSVSVGNLQTGEVVKKLHFYLEKDGKPRGITLRNDILVIRFKDYDNKLKFYIYNIHQKGSDSSSRSPSFNVIHGGKEEVCNGYHQFRINNFSIIENIEDSFIFTDFC